jgi:hypothetical protein
LALVGLGGAAPGGIVDGDISNASGPQDEATIAVDPANPRVLLAASNSIDRPLRVYSSTDGGVRWTSRELPTPTGSCDFDPSVGIDERGRQFVAFLAYPKCRREFTSEVFVAHRGGPAATWVIPRNALPTTAHAEDRIDDKPWLAVDASPASPTRGRIYVAFQGAGLTLTHSDDGAVTWSKPTLVGGIGGIVAVTVGPDGALYMAGVDRRPGSSQRLLRLARSTDGGARLETQTAFARIASPSPRCGANGWSIPAQSARCVDALPSLAVDNSSGRVYLTFANLRRRVVETEILAYTPELARVAEFTPPRVVAPASRGSADHFLPALAVEPKTAAVVVCFYVGPRGRERGTAVYSCTRSTNGGLRWSKPVPVASRPSDENQLRANREFQFGDYEAVAATPGTAHPVWTDSRKPLAKGEEIYTATVRW